jgi:Uma2 family endonuclease
LYNLVKNLKVIEGGISMSFAVPDNFLTYEQFIKISESIMDNTGFRTEYSNGEILYFSPNAKQSRSIFNICTILTNMLPHSCIAINELHIKFENNEYRIPDISVFCGRDIRNKYENDILHLEIPKLVFEVLSDSTEKNDREHKMKLYANAGIEEYLLVDYKNKTIEQYYLNDTSYKLNKNYRNDDKCVLLLYPQVSFIVNDVFKIFMNE